MNTQINLKTICCKELADGGQIELYIDKSDNKKILARFVNSVIYPNDIFVFPEQRIDRAIELLEGKKINKKIRLELYSQF
jgi:hypothetical protein